MQFLRSALLCSLCLAAGAASAQFYRVASESRDAASGFVSTEYLMIHAATKDCVEFGYRNQEWRDDLVGKWIARNAGYLRASRAYTRRRFDELETDTSKDGRLKAEDQVLRVVYTDALIASNTLLHGRGSDQTCKRFTRFVEDGSLDFAKSPKLAAELADLLASATPYVDAADEKTDPLSLTVRK